MLRLGLRLSVVLAGLCLLPILLIRARPYDDGGLRDFLTAGDCAAPCFLDLHPGSTTMLEADTLIRNQRWVGRVEHSLNALNGQPGAIFWTWNGEQPAFFADLGRGSIRSFNGERVSEVEVEVSLTLGDVWLSLGPPDAYATTVQGASFPHIALDFVMLYRNFAILGITNCPYYDRWWQSGITLSLRRVHAFTGPFQADNQPMARRIKQLERAWCER